MTGGQPVRRMFADGQGRWPGIALELEVFERHCAGLLGFDPRVSERFGAELYLCCACAARIPAAIAAFERETSAAVRAAIGRVRADPEFVEDTLQALYEKLLLAPRAKVAEYSGRGPLQVWTRVAAARVAVDALRERRASWARRADLNELLAEGGPGPESTLTRAQYAETFQRALQEALASLSPQDRNLLRMHVIGRCSIDQLARSHGIHRATAARWLARARAQVFESVRRRVVGEHGDLTDGELQNIALALGAELDLTLSSEAAGSMSSVG